MKPPPICLPALGATLPPSVFLVCASLLLTLHYGTDFLLSRLMLGRSCPLPSWLAETFIGLGATVPDLGPREQWMMTAFGLPFLCAALFLCLLRLRSARMPLWLIALIFVPVVKLFLFLALAIVPTRANGEKKEEASFRGLPRSLFGTAGVAILLPAALAAIASAVSAQILGHYGWALFAGIPFANGFLASSILGIGRPSKLAKSILVAMLSLTLTGGLFLAFGVEGVICIVMAAPLAVLFAALGGAAGHSALSPGGTRRTAQMLSVPTLALPLMLAAECLRPGPPTLLRVATAVEIEAPARVVWQNVVQYTVLPPPTEFVFKLGIAYPIRSEIAGYGPGAVRRCVFTTGTFVEPVEIWDEPRLLEFRVAVNPEPLREWSPRGEIHPRHLNGFLVAERGQFRLTPLPGDQTLLEGTTWYRHSMWPVAYWQLWSDQIIHAIHGRVLRHLKRQAESEITAHPTAALWTPEFSGSGREERRHGFRFEFAFPAEELMNLEERRESTNV